MLRIGAHVSVAGGIDNAVDNLREVGGNCGQLFTHSPQVWREPAVAAPAATRFRVGTAAHLAGPWVVHASYLVNLATPDPALRERSIASLQGEIDVADTLGIEYVNVHLGAHTGAGVEAGLAAAASALDALSVPERVTVLIETDAGAGTKLGGDFAHIADVLATCERDLGVCLDTAHTWAAGYDLGSPAAVDRTLETFDSVVGREHLRCVHLNDSKHDRGTNRDEHAHVGEGEIGVAGMAAVVNHPAVRALPLILETPTEDGRGFAWNIDRVRELREPTDPAA